MRDRLLLIAAAVFALVVGFQLVITFLQPPWIGPVTDWLRTAAAWPELVIVVYVALWLRRMGRAEALSWGLFGMGVLSYVIARTWWTLEDTFIYHHGVPFPILSDLFFVLQYPFFFLAVIFIPCGRFWGRRILVILDTVLWMGAVAAIAWYFLLAPLFVTSGLSPLAREVSLGYPIADLFLLFAMALILVRPLRYREDRPVVAFLIASVVCLILGDAGVSWLILHPAHVYRTGHFPDLFWLASDLLVPLAAVTQVRVVQYTSWKRPKAAPEATDTVVENEESPGLQWDDLMAALRLFLPIVAALLAGVAILLRATMPAARGDGSRDLAWTLAVSFGLLLLVIIRQGVAFLETARLRRERATARATEQALRELDRRKDEFLSVVSHELRTPLASLQGFIQLLARRLENQQPHEAGDTGRARNGALLQTALDYSEASVRRLTRLADDLVDDARIRQGQLDFHIEPRDLGAIVRGAVEEQRALEPDRTIQLDIPVDQPTPVLADADRIEQVVTNYLTNALKYSQKDRPVTVHLETESGENGDQARVSVHDEGPGLSPEDQAHVWERFPRIEGVEVQSGSGVSLGLGLHISKAIVEGHHGHVGVHSSPSHGSTFWFTLPLARHSD